MKKNTTTIKTHKKSPVKLSKNEIKQLKNRFQQLQDKRKSSTQSFIPYENMTQDGICRISGNWFSRTVEFYDTNYETSDINGKEDIFGKYCDLLNYFDDEIRLQLTYENQKSTAGEYIHNFDIPHQNDDFNEIRDEYSQMLKDRYLDGSGKKRFRRFLTFSINANSLKAARTALDSIANEVIDVLADIGVDGKIMNGEERLESLYSALNPYCDDPFIFDWQYSIKSGHSTKDFIAPPSIKFGKRDFALSSGYGSCYSISILSSQLSDEILKDFLEKDNLLSLNMHIASYDQTEALKFVSNKLTELESDKIDMQQKAMQNGYDPDILPQDLIDFIDEMKQWRDDLKSKNERMFSFTITVRNYAKTKKELQIQNDWLKRIVQQNNCKIIPLDYIQEQALASSLPLGFNAVPINRTMKTSAIAAFVPFRSSELFQSFQAAYYGINPITKQMIMCDLDLLENSNALYLGTPGSGKSFAVKRMIIDRFLKTICDIAVCDPEGEYYPMIKRLGGEVIPIHADSDLHINPMDIVWDVKQEEDPVSVKSDFILSLLELIVGGQFGLAANEKSIIDRCVRRIYSRFLANNPCQENMPILEDLYNELLQEGPVVKHIADSLEMYVKGSQNVFNHRTNVDINNRVVCFDIKKLGKQIKKIGMLIIQDIVWNKVSRNRDNKIPTYYYIDEFHLLLRDEQTAEYSAEMWKRFRKWGGKPCGITQNVSDLLMSLQIENIFKNSDLVYMLNQAPGDRDILAEKLNISTKLQKYIKNSKPGHGLIKYGSIILPFEDDFPKDTTMYKLLNTKPSEFESEAEAEKKIELVKA